MIDELSQCLTWGQDKLLANLALLTTELAAKHKELGFVEVEYLQARHATYYNSSEPSHAGRERDVEYATLQLRVSKAELTAEIAALTEEKFFLIRVLEGHHAA